MADALDDEPTVMAWHACELVLREVPLADAARGLLDGHRPHHDTVLAARAANHAIYEEYSADPLLCLRLRRQVDDLLTLVQRSAAVP